VPFRAFDDAVCHGSDLLHELVALEFAVLHLRQLIFPFAGQLGRAQLVDFEPAQQGNQ